jgi:hypothetical protein
MGETKSGCLTRLCDATRRDVIERRDDIYKTRLMIPEHFEASLHLPIRDEMTPRKSSIPTPIIVVGLG